MSLLSIAESMMLRDSFFTVEKQIGALLDYFSSEVPLQHYSPRSASPFEPQYRGYYKYYLLYCSCDQTRFDGSSLYTTGQTASKIFDMYPCAGIHIHFLFLRGESTYMYIRSIAWRIHLTLGLKTHLRVHRVKDICYIQSKLLKIDNANHLNSSCSSKTTRAMSMCSVSQSTL
jgi:predicted nucleic-acid-binding Zn-ribbon protein